MKFIPDLEKDINAIKSELGISEIEELLDIPKEIYIKDFSSNYIPAKGLSEKSILEKAFSIESKNKDIEYYLGAGIYNHYIPAVVDQLSARSEFYTSYTPYQAEISQGYLQAMFEYQSVIARLTALEISNASLYDAATALVEACIMAKSIKSKNEILVADNINPEYIKVLCTYNIAKHFELKFIPSKDGAIDVQALKNAISNNTSAVVIQNPNFFGIIEDTAEIARTVKEINLLLITVFYPISLGILIPPGEYGTDIAVAEGQCLGNPPSFGGPGLGIIATKKEYIRKLPGRIVGLTKDTESNTGFVLTLQAREQHIRRQKASSNICSNHALCAFRSLIYLSALGDKGLKNLASINLKIAHNLSDLILSRKIAKLKFNKPFFNEFVLEFDTEEKLDKFRNRLKENNILFGLKLKNYYPDMHKSLLVTVTEQNNIERLTEVLNEL